MIIVDNVVILETLKKEDILIALESVSEVKYTGSVHREKHEEGDMIAMLKEMLTKSFKMHVYNISYQYSELKHQSKVLIF